MGAAIYGNGIRVFQSPDVVSITYEMIHETRIIPLDGRPHLHDEIVQFTGNGRGYWDGDTLVIESMGFTDRTSVGGGPHSTKLKTTERIRRVDPEMLEYRITIGHSLSGERVYERQVAAALARGEEPPPRSNGMSFYGPPAEDADIFSINEGQIIE